MKKLILGVTIALTVLLSACGSKLDYIDFESNQVDSFLSAETINEDTYFIYYYSSNSDYSEDVKKDILNFINKFDEANFYMLDVSVAEDSSTFDQYESVPTVLVIDNGDVYEKFESKSGIESFINKYSGFEMETFRTQLDYADFDNLQNFSDIYDRPEEKYVVYYYSEFCGYCNQIKDFMLSFANENDAGIKVYMLDVQKITGAYPFEGTYGTPTIFIVENGIVTYTTSGATSVPEYLEGLN